MEQICFKAKLYGTINWWSNSKKGLLNNDQSTFTFLFQSQKILNLFEFYRVFFYYKYRANTSGTKRDGNSKTIYEVVNIGKLYSFKERKMEFPFLMFGIYSFVNPKAKERSKGILVAKPILLLEQIIQHLLLIRMI